MDASSIESADASGHLRILEPVFSPVVLAGLVSNGPSLRVLGYGETTESRLGSRISASGSRFADDIYDSLVKSHGRGYWK